MAEVKTYKCDICGEVFHADGEYGDRIAMISEGLSKDEENLKRYNHLCPKCMETICNVIKEPGMVDELRGKIHTQFGEMNELKSLLHQLCIAVGAVLPYGVYSPDSTDYEVSVGDAMDRIKVLKCEKHDLNEQLLKLRKITSCAIGLAFGMAITLIIMAVC